MIPLQCPNCHRRTKAPFEAAGKWVKCRSCGYRFQVTPDVAAVEAGGPDPARPVGGGAARTGGADLGVGAVLGEYQLLKKLGQGGMGTVWQARHRRLKRLVAVKVLPPQLLNDRTALARFAREMEAVGQLDHPNIVRAYDAGEADGIPFLVMEFLQGQDLGRLIAERGPQSAADACLFISQAVAGLQHVFEHGLIHRDLKPSNLMLVEAAPPSLRAAGSTSAEPPAGPVQIKILDLGLAHLHASATLAQLTGEGRLMGTPDYVAPEQIETPHRVDIRADIYSLGCTLYHLLAGRTPFAGAGFMQKLAAHLHGQPQRLGELRPDLPPGLAAVVAKMMAKQPADRYAAPAEVAAALQPFRAVATLLPAHVGPAPEWPTLPPKVVLPPSRPAVDEGTVDVARQEATVRSDGAGRRAAVGLTPPDRRSWVGPALLLGVVVAGLIGLTIFLARSLTKPAAPPPAAPPADAPGPPDLSADIEECRKLLFNDQGTAGYVVRVGPQRLAVWRSAAEQGAAEGEYLLGRCYEEGAGVPQDRGKGLALHRQAAARGFDLSQLDLGTACANGFGVAKDLKEAAGWYRKAAEQGNAVAQFRLGLAYAHGDGVPHDPTEADRWFLRAMDQGYAPARDALLK